jgi:hypothetical protein
MLTLRWTRSLQCQPGLAHCSTDPHQSTLAYSSSSSSSHMYSINEENSQALHCSTESLVSPQPSTLAHYSYSSTVSSAPADPRPAINLNPHPAINLEPSSCYQVNPHPAINLNSHPAINLNPHLPTFMPRPRSQMLYISVPAHRNVPSRTLRCSKKHSNRCALKCAQPLLLCLRMLAVVCLPSKEPLDWHEG